MNRRNLLRGAAAVLAAGSGLWALAAEPKPKEKEQEQVIRITARKFTFLPNEVTLKKGIPVILELTTADVVMGFNAPDFNLRADIIPGQAARVRLVPDKVGSFEYLCDIFCGEGHERMSGRIRVVA
jgi:cytochrome c oxidase subunit 2